MTWGNLDQKFQNQTQAPQIQKGHTQGRLGENDGQKMTFCATPIYGKHGFTSLHAFSLGRYTQVFEQNGRNRHFSSFLHQNWQFTIFALGYPQMLQRMETCICDIKAHS